MVVWNNTNSSYIDSVYVYKETNVTDTYSKIGAASYVSMVFSDSLSNPVQSSNLYKISLIDKCGLETDLSETHKTMHLSINQGQGNTWNLIWEGYSGFTVSTYNIYRGTTTNNLILLAQVSGNIYQFSDFYPPAGSVYYQIEVVAPGSQFNAPFAVNDIQKVNSTNFYSTSRSNIVSNNITGLNNLYADNNFFNLYPNPAKDEIILTTKNSEQYIVKIYNMVGWVVKTIRTNGESPGLMCLTCLTTCILLNLIQET